MKRAIAWTRVSTGRQDEGVRQLDQIKKYCVGKYELLTDKTIEEIISGKADDRTGMDEVLQLTKADADIIIVSEASRATRKNEDDYLDLLNIVRAIQRTGLDLYFLGSSQTYSADKKLTLIDVITLVIESDRNAKELETMKFRLKSGKKTKVEKGGYIGGNFPYGYYNNEVKGLKRVVKKDYFSINEDEAVVVRLIFDLISIQGYTVSQAAIHIYRTQGFKRDSKGILNMLRNPVYKGEFTILGVLQNVPAIVTAEQFEQVQIKIGLNHQFINKGNKHYNQLKGLVKCACGCNMYINNVGTNKGVIKFGYKCASKGTVYTHIKPCKNGGINSALLADIVWNTTKKFINVDDFKAKTEEQKKVVNSEVKAIEKNIVTLMTEKNVLADKIESLTDTIVEADKNSKPILLKRLSEMVINGEKQEKRIEKYNIEVAKMKNRLKDLSVNLLPSFVNEVSEEGKHEIFVKYIDTITYYSINRNKGFVVILYKNKVETIIMTSTRPVKVAYALPLNFKFNYENRTVFDVKGFKSKEAKMLYKILDRDDETNDDEATIDRALQFILSEAKELTYDDIMAQYPIQDYLMAL